MSRVQVIVVVLLGIALLVVAAGAIWLVAGRAAEEPLPTLPAATLPPSAPLLTRLPLCQETVGAALTEAGLTGEVVLDPQRATLEVWLEIGGDELPAGPIWSAFEAVLAGRAGGCTGYADLIVRAGPYVARVSVDDLVAWGEGALDDGAFSDRVTLTQPR